MHAKTFEHKNADHDLMRDQGKKNREKKETILIPESEKEKNETTDENKKPILKRATKRTMLKSRDLDNSLPSGDHD